MSNSICQFFVSYHSWQKETIDGTTAKMDVPEFPELENPVITLLDKVKY